MKPTSIGLILAVTASFTAIAHAQPGPRGNRPPPLFVHFDTDHDMEISATEIAAANTILTAMDTNHDGKITPDEARPQRSKPKPDDEAPPEMRPQPPIVKSLDLDGDGNISAAELAKAQESLQVLDLNHDGMLSPEELHPRKKPANH
jgi:EF hand